MKVFVGKQALGESNQEPFLEHIHCDECGQIAQIMFVAFEDSKDNSELVCDLHKPEKPKPAGKKSGTKAAAKSEDTKPDDKTGEYWLTGKCAVAVYLCTGCRTPKAIVTQE